MGSKSKNIRPARLHRTWNSASMQQKAVLHSSVDWQNLEQFLSKQRPLKHFFIYFLFFILWQKTFPFTMSWLALDILTLHLKCSYVEVMQWQQRMFYQNRIRSNDNKKEYHVGVMLMSPTALNAIFRSVMQKLRQTNLPSGTKIEILTLLELV